MPARNHPRIELLRCKGLIAWKQWQPEPWLATPAVKTRILELFEQTAPLMGWLNAEVGRHRAPSRVRGRRVRPPRAQYDAEWVIKWNRVQALAYAASESAADAVRHADLAVEAAEVTDLLEFHAEALCDRAAILEQFGHRDRGRTDLESALRLYQHKEHVVGQIRVQARLLLL